MTRDEVEAAARDWLGVKWAHQGRSRRGVDCIGLVIKVGETFGIPYEDLLGYSRQPTGYHFLDHVRKFLTPVSFSDTRRGNIGIFRQVQFPCHIGIFTEKDGLPHIINSRADRGRVVEETFKDGEHGLNLIQVLGFPGLEN